MATFLTELLSAAFFRLHDWSRATPYRHFWRIYWAREPGVAWVRHEQRHDLGPDRFVCIAPCTRIDRGLAGEAACLHLHIHALFGEPVDHLQEQVLEVPIDAALAALLDPLVAGGPMIWRNQHQQRAVLPLAAAIAARLPLPPDDPEDPLVAACCAFMEEHLSESCPNDLLAAVAGRSVNQLLRRFKVAKGMTPQAWLRRHRLERAAIMLEHGEATIETIAEACGFADRSHLTKRFAEHFGVGPGTWWRQCFEGDGHDADRNDADG